jgi:phosphohistidine phosphatase
MGDFMKAQGVEPDLILCSTAVRARQTLDLVLPRLPCVPQVAHEDGLYLASAPRLLARVRKLEPPVRHALLIGHDPGMHMLAVELSGEGAAKSLEALAAKFPTAALAVIQFSTRDWSKIAPARGRLELFQPCPSLNLRHAGPHR